MLRAHGVDRALLSFRSTVLALGPPPGDAGWLVPVVHDGAGLAVETVVLVDAALSVSGSALRAFDDRGTERGQSLDLDT